MNTAGTGSHSWFEASSSWRRAPVLRLPLPSPASAPRDREGGTAPAARRGLRSSPPEGPRPHPARMAARTWTTPAPRPTKRRLLGTRQRPSSVHRSSHTWQRLQQPELNAGTAFHEPPHPSQPARVKARRRRVTAPARPPDRQRQHRHRRPAQPRWLEHQRPNAGRSTRVIHEIELRSRCDQISP